MRLICMAMRLLTSIAIPSYNSQWRIKRNIIEHFSNPLSQIFFGSKKRKRRLKKKRRRRRIHMEVVFSSNCSSVPNWKSWEDEDHCNEVSLYFLFVSILSNIVVY